MPHEPQKKSINPGVHTLGLPGFSCSLTFMIGEEFISVTLFVECSLRKYSHIYVFQFFKILGGLYNSWHTIMLHIYSRQERSATTIVSECPPPHQVSTAYYNSSKSVYRASHSVTPHQRSFQVQKSTPLRLRQDLRIASFNTSRPSGHDMPDREGSVGAENEFTKGYKRLSWNVPTPTNGYSISDEDAAKQIERGLARRQNNDLTVRIFHSLMNRQAIFDDADMEIDSLLVAADKIIFNGKLSRRVQWRWSFLGEPGYDCELLGTTALLNTHPFDGGFQTLIVLSSPLLKNKQYSRDLLLSAFLHELIHCYLFIQCGLNHARDDGHTEGFRKIARLIEKRFGQQRLHLCNMRANLDYFRVYDNSLKIEQRSDSSGSECFESRCGLPGSPGSPVHQPILETRYRHRTQRNQLRS